MTTERFFPERCKAITYSRRGDPKDVLQYEDDYLVQRSISKDSVLVKIEAAGINPVDWKTMKFLPSLWGKKVAGKDYSGTIVEVHEDSIDKRFKIGDKVYGQIEFTEKMKNGSGTLVQYAICPIETIAIRPNHLSAIDLGGITTVAQTALVVVKYSDILFQSGKKKPRILVCGGSSAVGLMTIPILKHKGAFVASTCSKAKFEVVSKRGADETFDYQNTDFKKDLINATKKDGKFDLIIDCVNSHDVWLFSPDIVQKGATYVNVGFDASQGTLKAISRNLSYHLLPTWLGGIPTKYIRPAGVGTRKTMDDLEELVNKGVIVPINDSVFEWDQIKEAFDRLQTNRTIGKVVIKVP